jgi:hypothetical protein
MWFVSSYSPHKEQQPVGRTRVFQNVIVRGKTLPNELPKVHPHSEGKVNLPDIVDVLQHQSLANFLIERSKSEPTRGLERARERIRVVREVKTLKVSRQVGLLQALSWPKTMPPSAGFFK